MSRNISHHYVTLLNLTSLSKHATGVMFKAGKIEANSRMEAGWEPFGLIEKDEKHYLIDHEGCGSFIALEDERDNIDWYEYTYVDGEMTSFNTVPTFRTIVDYNDLITEKCITKKRVRLDKFIRTFGTRLDRNYVNTENFLDGRIDREGNRISIKTKMVEA
jgi:hypothetical protein